MRHVLTALWSVVAQMSRNLVRYEPQLMRCLEKWHLQH